MIFTKRLRDGVRSGQIRCSIRIWMRPHVKAGNRYRMEEGEIEVDSVLPMSLADVTPELARESGFKGVFSIEAGGRIDPYVEVQQIVDALVEQL